MIKWRYARYGWLVLFGVAETSAIVAMIVNPVQIVGLSIGAGFCVFMIYAILANWEDESEENTTKREEEQ